jgi:hypothetical protein
LHLNINRVPSVKLKNHDLGREWQVNFLCGFLRHNHMIARGRLVKWGQGSWWYVKASRERVEGAFKSASRLEMWLEIRIEQKKKDLDY